MTSIRKNKLSLIIFDRINYSGRTGYNRSRGIKAAAIPYRWKVLRAFVRTGAAGLHGAPRA